LAVPKPKKGGELASWKKKNQNLKDDEQSQLKVDGPFEERERRHPEKKGEKKRAHDISTKKKS